MQNINDDKMEEKPSVLQLMVENPEGVKATIDLIKGEVDVHEKQEKPKSPTEDIARQFSSLSSLLSNSRVKQMVNDVAGENVLSIIDRTLGTIDSSCDTDVKREAFTKGLKNIHTNLKGQDTLGENQSFNFAASLIGLNERRLKSLQIGPSKKLGF